MMTVAQAKLALFAFDQIAKYTAMWMKSRDNEDMTEAEADALIKETQDDAIATGAAWDKSRGRTTTNEGRRR